MAGDWPAAEIAWSLGWAGAVRAGLRPGHDAALQPQVARTVGRSGSSGSRGHVRVSGIGDAVVGRDLRARRRPDDRDEPVRQLQRPDGRIVVPEQPVPA